MSKNQIEERYIALLDFPEVGNLHDLEKKYLKKAKEFRETKDSGGFHLSAVQENGEIISAYSYLKTLWSLPIRKKRSLPKRINCISNMRLTGLDYAYSRLKLFTKSALVLLLATTSVQFLLLSLGVPSFVSEGKSQESVFIIAKIEEENHNKIKSNQKLFKDNHEIINKKIINFEQPEIIQAAKYCKTDKVKNILLESNTSVNSINNKLESPLHWAARRNCVETAKVLLAYNADSNLRDIGGRTPLDWAESSYNLEMIKLLKLKR